MCLWQGWRKVAISYSCPTKIQHDPSLGVAVSKLGFLDIVRCFTYCNANSVVMSCLLIKYWKGMWTNISRFEKWHADLITPDMTITKWGQCIYMYIIDIFYKYHIIHNIQFIIYYIIILFVSHVLIIHMYTYWINDLLFLLLSYVTKEWYALRVFLYS